MQPDTWLAWWVCGAGRYPIFFRVVGLLESEVNTHILELVSGKNIFVSQKFVDRLQEVGDPHFAYPQPSRLPANKPLHGDGGALAPQELAMAAVASPVHADSVYGQRWRKDTCAF